MLFEILKFREIPEIPGTQYYFPKTVLCLRNSADIHPVGVQVDSAVQFVLDGVESSEKASLVACCFLLPPL